MLQLFTILAANGDGADGADGEDNDNCDDDSIDDNYAAAADDDDDHHAEYCRCDHIVSHSDIFHDSDGEKYDDGWNGRCDVHVDRHVSSDNRYFENILIIALATSVNTVVICVKSLENRRRAG